MSTADEIRVTSVVGYKTGQPIVEIAWGENRGQLTAEEARAHAMRVLECADAAESDLFIFTWVTDSLGMPAPQAATLLADFRAFRERREKRV
jgi:hypothetical protein